MPEREATGHRSTAEPKPAKKRRTHTDTPPPLSRVEDKVGPIHSSVTVRCPGWVGGLATVYSPPMYRVSTRNQALH